MAIRVTLRPHEGTQVFETETAAAAAIARAARQARRFRKDRNAAARMEVASFFGSQARKARIRAAEKKFARFPE